jgi:sugar porter (SP) family MFS transporter
MGDAAFGLVSSIFSIGGLVGALCGGPLASRRGRLSTTRLTAVFFMLGPFLEAISSNITTLAIGRFLSGVSAGASIVVVPIYISEVCPITVRGFFGVLTQVMVNGGILIAQTLGYFFSYGQYWRFVLAFGGVVGLTQCILLCFAVESPKWLYLQGHVLEGRLALERIRGTTKVEAEIEDWGIRGVVPASAEEEGLLSTSPSDAAQQQVKTNLGFITLIKSAYYRPAILISMSVMAAQQFCGINSIVMYSVSILSTILPQLASLISVLISVVNLVATILCMPLPDRLGRKTCLLLSIAGMGFFSLLLAIGIETNVPVLSALATVFFVAAFAVGLGPVPFLLTAELVDERAIGSAQSAALAANWLSTFAVAQFFPMIKQALGGGKVYFIFAGIALFFVFFLGYFLPETKGKKGMYEVWGKEAPVEHEE